MSTTALGHPDQAIFDLCAKLAVLREEWQLLWTSMVLHGAPMKVEAEKVWQRYSEEVWPCLVLSGCYDHQIHDDDLPGQLRKLHPATREGLAAKARAVMEIEDAARYADARDDSAQLTESVVADAAGPGWMRMGEERHSVR